MNSNRHIFFYITLAFLLSLPTALFAQVDVMVGIPGIDTDAEMGAGDYINALYTLSISIAAFLAVLKLIMAGVKYMLTDVITSKESAKKDIKGALLGLLIVIGAALILSTINPNLRYFNIFDNLNSACYDGAGNLQSYCAPVEAPEAGPAREIGENVLVVLCNGDCTAAGISNNCDRVEEVGNNNATIYCYTDATEDTDSVTGELTVQNVRAPDGRSTTWTRAEWENERVEMSLDVLTDSYNRVSQYDDSRAQLERTCRERGGTTISIYSVGGGVGVQPQQYAVCS